MGVPSTSSRPESSKPSISPVEPHTSDEPLPSFTTTSETYAHDLYRHSVEPQEIESFLEESSCYDSVEKKWTIPGTPTKTEDLLSSVFNMLSSIVQRFAKPSQPGVEREVVNTENIPACQGTNEKGYRICPVIVVRAAGPSFEISKPRKPTTDSQEPAKSIGFGGMATYFSVKLDSELGSEKEDLDEMGSYARCVPRHRQCRRPN